MANGALARAKNAKRDEFYTRIDDVKQELDNYRDHFKGKVIYLNCDDPEYSAFWQYFSYNFELFGLKKLIATHYEHDGSSSYKYVYEQKDDAGDPKVVKTKLNGNGDFRSEECIELLKESDIIATNPPFSLWREYIAQLIEYDKKFTIIGNQNAITYKEVFPLIKDGVIWLGNTTNKTMWFAVPEGYELKEGNYKVEFGRYLVKVPAISWFTNLKISKPHEELVLTKFYADNEDHYPKYDNYNAIEVSKVKEIPMDYTGVMGVPITYLNNHNPDQFKILGSQRWAKSDELLEVYTGNSVPPESDKKTLINGKETYDRIFIINKNPVYEV